MLVIISVLSIFIAMVYYEKTLRNGTKTNFKNKNKILINQEKFPLTIHIVKNNYYSLLKSLTWNKIKTVLDIFKQDHLTVIGIKVMLLPTTTRLCEWKLRYSATWSVYIK